MFRQHNTGPENEATRKEALAMDGSAASLVAMPIVATLGLVAWLSLIAYGGRIAHRPLLAGTPSCAAGSRLFPSRVRPITS
jgi:hypothetical protein